MEEDLHKECKRELMRLRIERDDTVQGLRSKIALMPSTFRGLAEDVDLPLKKKIEELDAFSYSVSHDLRAPLRAISGFSKILEEGSASGLDDEGRHALSVIRENALRMGCLIDDLLALSRSGRGELERRDVDMGELARSVAAELRDSVPQRKVAIRVQDLPRTSADPGLMRQVWANLLSNAVKFTSSRDESVIDVGFVPLGVETTYFVKDNGVGFDMAYVGKLFGVFQRLHGSAEYEGNGIGLAIVRRIVERHGGKVWAEGKVGKGATFFFSLPVGSPENVGFPRHSVVRT